jgi:hypothetical protein
MAVVGAHRERTMTAMKCLDVWRSNNKKDHARIYNRLHTTTCVCDVHLQRRWLFRIFVAPPRVVKDDTLLKRALFIL